MTLLNNKINRRILLTSLLMLVVVATVVLIAGPRSTEAQSPAPAEKWLYREMSFNTPVTFATVPSDGYYINGVLTPLDPPGTTVAQIFNWWGQVGWELVSSTNNQVFIFKLRQP